MYKTPRLELRPPRADEAEVLFRRIASDPEVTRFVAWPTHTSIEDTEAFLAFSRAEWERWPVGPLLIVSQLDGAILGTTGLAFETPQRAATGFVLARNAWGAGFASEALRAVIDTARVTGVRRLYALCHVQHDRSMRVLRRCGFEREAILRRHTVFPNLGVPEPQDVCCYALLPERAHET